jgi:hypothetical protein
MQVRTGNETAEAKGGGQQGQGPGSVVQGMATSEPPAPSAGGRWDV